MSFRIGDFWRVSWFIKNNLYIFILAVLATTEAHASRAHAIFLLDRDLLVDSSFLVALQIYGSFCFWLYGLLWEIQSYFSHCYPLGNIILKYHHNCFPLSLVLRSFIVCLSMHDFEFIQFGTHQLKSVGSYLLPYCGLCLLVPQIFNVNFRFFLSILGWQG